MVNFLEFEPQIQEAKQEKPAIFSHFSRPTAVTAVAAGPQVVPLKQIGNIVFKPSFFIHWQSV